MIKFPLMILIQKEYPYLNYCHLIDERENYAKKVMDYINTQKVKEKDKVVLKDAIVRLTTTPSSNESW